MQPLSNILKAFIKNFGVEDGVALNAIRRQWCDIVGQPIAVHTYPDIIKNKVLTIIVDTPQWMHHLDFFRGDISEKLKSYNIGGIRFRLGKIPSGGTDTQKVQDMELSDEDMRFVENTLRHVKDGELKDRFKKLIVHGLTKGKRK